MSRKRLNHPITRTTLGQSRCAAAWNETVIASVVEFGHVRIGVQHGTERLFQRAEPRFVAAPAFHAFLEDGPTHLLIAEGIEGAVALVIFETTLLEGKLKEIQHAAHLAFQIGDEILVYDAMDFSGHHPVEMRHQAYVIVVEAAYVGKFVRKRRGVCKAEGEVCPATRDWMPAHVDDFCIWQNEMDQSNVPEIVTVLVDKERLVPGPVQSRILEVF